MKNKKFSSIVRGIFLSILGLFVTLFLVILTRSFVYHRAHGIPGSPKVTPHPNAFDIYDTACRLEKGKDDVDQGESEDQSADKYTLQKKRELVAENTPVFNVIHQAFRYEYMSPQVSSFDAPDMFVHDSQDRALARLLSLQAQVRKDDNDWDGAADSSLDSIELGVQISHRGVLIEGLVGLACQGIGRTSARDVVNHVSAKAAKKDSLRMVSLERKMASLADIFQEEERGNILSGIDFGKKGTIFTKFLANDLAIPDYANYMENLIERTKLPYRVSLSVPDPFVKKYDPIVSIIAPAYDKARFKFDNAITLNRMLEIEFALRAYSLDHRQYPDTLAALSPNYLPTIPADPYASSGTFRYKRTPESYLLYSIGPDGVDDGGKPIETPTKTGNDRYRIRDDKQKGDIVAGISR